MKNVPSSSCPFFSITSLQRPSLPELSDLNLATLNLKHASTTSRSSSRSASPTNSLCEPGSDVKLVLSSFDEADAFVYVPPSPPSPSESLHGSKPQALLITGPAVERLRRLQHHVKSVDLKGARLKPYRLTSRQGRHTSASSSSTSSRRTSMSSTTSLDFL